MASRPGEQDVADNLGDGEKDEEYIGIRRRYGCMIDLLQTAGRRRRE
ncbi:hypothetical protein [Mesorhizobium sp. M5C.F.Ca.IN.020.29.1.1]|nr:hypothetical protein [Mesorhizobium sp. M5C.F.Ca.IN.020.29.1.1]